MYSIIAGLGTDLTTLAQQGGAAYRDRFELVYRRESAHSNDVWQADHTELDVMVLDGAGRPARPWLTVVLDDHCAPRGASLYPRLSREELGGRLLGPMAYLKPKGEGDSSMPGNQRSCPGVERGVAGPARYG